MVQLNGYMKLSAWLQKRNKNIFIIPVLLWYRDFFLNKGLRNLRERALKKNLLMIQ